MFSVKIGRSTVDVRFYYESPKPDSNGTMRRNIHVGITRRAGEKFTPDDEVVTSANMNLRVNGFNKAKARKLVLIKALHRGLYTIEDGKKVLHPFFNKSERTLFWNEYRTISKGF